MDAILSILSLPLLLVAFAVAFFAGVIKGMVGFAMPMIIISGLSTFISPEIALAGLILPTLVSNWMQIALYDPRELWPAMRRFKVFLAVGGLCLLVSAQLVMILPPSTMLIVLGCIVTAFSLWQLSGRAPDPGRLAQSKRLDAGIGAVAGLIGGVSGIFGPPTVAYLTAIGTEKRMQMLAQGMIYGLGAVMLTVGHIGSGILNAQTIPISALLILPAIVGMLVGTRLSATFDQATFRRATLIVLMIGGLNLLRRGLLG